MADRRVAEIAFRRLPLACLAAAAVAGCAVGPEATAKAAAVPWLIALAAVGLPHGAADLAVSRRLCGRESLAAVWAAYITVIVAVVAAYALAPVTVIVLFVLLSVWHFGRAHAAAEPLARPRSRLAKIGAAVARGGIALGVPLAARPRAAREVAADLLGLTGHAADAAALSAAAVSSFGLAILAAALVGLACEVASTGHLADGQRRAGRLLVELAVIALLGLVTHPLFAVGCTFLFWHAWRQMDPLAAILTGKRPDSWRSLGRSVVQIHVAALPLLVPAWLAVGLAWWHRSATHSCRDAAILSIGVYLAVTAPHELLDRLSRGPAGAANHRLPGLPRPKARLQASATRARSGLAAGNAARLSPPERR
ncbi:MAG: Brp/Blh family beta-carotene 15,15'-dioxygenase [Planctomycetia bacterium]